MKVCPKCNQSYTDEGLNFCLADGELLMNAVNEAPTQIFNDPSPPTLFMDASRTTNPNHTPWQVDQPPQPLSPWQSQAQGIQNQPYGVPTFNTSRDQTLPVISLILGVLAFLLVCCFGGVWLGVPAAIVGYLGMKNADADPSKYMGRGMAVAGLVLGIVSFLCSIVVIFLRLLAS
jgi:hypothetical protein